MAYDIKNIVANRLGENYELHEQYVNPTLVDVFRTIGFDRVYFGVAAVGRNNPVVAGAIRDVLDMDLPNMVQMDCALLSGLLAEAIVQRTPPHLDAVYFCNSGTESVEAAMKFARAHTGRDRMCHFTGGWHGLTLGALSAMGNEEFREGFGQLLASDEVAAGDLVARVPGAVPARVDALMATLDVDPAWRLHRASDGQRRRVQLAAGLARPFDVLLLDEITVDLDVLGRADLMAFLMRETEGERKATVVYATHIFDGLDAWPTHVAFLGRGGRLARCVAAADLPDLAAGRLLELVTRWLREEAAAHAAAVEAELAAKGVEGSGVPGAPAALPSWSNGWAAGRMTSTIQNASNAVMRM